MKKILITGFKPFGDYVENVSEIAATEIKALGDYSVQGIVFSTIIFPENGEDYGETIVAYAKEIKANAIVSLGIASAVQDIRIESRAINWVENEKYCLRSEQRRVIDETLILKKEFKVDLEKWSLSKLWHRALLEEKMSFSEADCKLDSSHDAGTFCCNALMFRTLRALQKNDLDIPYLFLHVSPSIELVKLKNALEFIVVHAERAWPRFY